MTTFERFERDIPRLMDELAPSSLPDYIDDMLLATARTSQRPAWRSLERWFPMGEIARPLPGPTIPWRPILIVVAVLVALAGMTIAYIGSQQPSIPAPFGLAGNGLLYVSDHDQDILTLDPATGETAVVFGGSESDFGPVVSRDGQQLLFARREGLHDALYVADIDGGDPSFLLEANGEFDWYDWSPDGRQIAVSYPPTSGPALTIIDVDDGTTTPLDPSILAASVWWRPTGGELVVSGSQRDAGGGLKYGIFLVPSDGTDATAVGETTYEATDWQHAYLAPDGRSLIFDRWNEAPGIQGRLHVLDVNTGIDRRITTDQAIGAAIGDGQWVEQSPRISPDGKTVAFELYTATPDGFRIAVASLDGGPVTILGDVHQPPSEGVIRTFSPDGRYLVVAYDDDATTVVFDLVTNDAVPVPGVSIDFASWQRVGAAR